MLGARRVGEAEGNGVGAVRPPLEKRAPHICPIYAQRTSLSPEPDRTTEPKMWGSPVIFALRQVRTVYCMRCALPTATDGTQRAWEVEPAAGERVALLQR